MKRLLSPRRVSVMLYFAGILTYFFNHFQRTAIPGTVFNELQSSTGMSATAISSLGAVFMYTYAASQFASGLFADKYGGIRCLVVGNALLCAGTVGFPLVNSPWLFILCRALTGIGAGVIYIALFKETDRLFAESFTLMLGVVLFIGSLGGVCAGYPLAAATARFGWRGALLIPGALLLAVYLVLVWLARRETLPPVQSAKLDLSPYREVLREPVTWQLTGCYVLTFGVYMIFLVVIAKKFMEDFAGWSPERASLAPTLMVVAATGLNFGSGALCKFVRRRTFFYRCGMASVLLGTLGFVVGILLRMPGWWFVAAMVLTAPTAGFSPVLGALVRETSDPRFGGTCLSFLSGASFVIAALGANAAGAIMDFCAGSEATAAAVQAGKAVVYPASSYLAIGAMLLVLTAVAWWSSLLLPRTGTGHNIHPALVRGRTLGKHLPRRAGKKRIRG